MGIAAAHGACREAEGERRTQEKKGGHNAEAKESSGEHHLASQLGDEVGKVYARTEEYAQATAQRKVEAHPAREQLPAAQEERDRVLRNDGQDRRAPFPRKQR